MNFDVAIVGAGPSGAVAAACAASSGARVLLADRAAFPRDKPCGGAISRWGLESLAMTLDGARSDANPVTVLDRLAVAYIPISAIRVRHRERVITAWGWDRALDNRDARLVVDGALGAVVHRSDFDMALVNVARARGATWLPEAKLVALRAEPGKGVALTFAVAERTETRHARFVIGADGTGSAVRRLSGIQECGPRARLVVAETGERALDVLRVPGGGVIEFDLGPLDDGLAGYGWHFPTPTTDVISRGVYDWRGRRPGDARALRGVFDRLVADRGVRASRVKPYTERVFVRGSPSWGSKRGILLTGEAAGLVDPISGEGIAQALSSGRLAAQAVLRALVSGRVDLERYAEELSVPRWMRHLRQTATMAPLVYGRHATLFGAALSATRTAVDAGSRWYTGANLERSQKVLVAIELAAQLARAGAQQARPVRT